MKINYVEHITKKGSIYVFKNVVPSYICDEFIKYIDSKTLGNTFITDNKFSKSILTILKDCIDFPFNVDVLNKITLSKSKSAIGEHFDKRFDNEKYKLFVYLNDVKNGGTYFKDGNEWIYVENSKGSIVIFDMHISHKGDEKQEDIYKYLIGIRLVEI